MWKFLCSYSISTNFQRFFKNMQKILVPGQSFQTKKSLMLSPIYILFRIYLNFTDPMLRCFPSKFPASCSVTQGLRGPSLHLWCSHRSTQRSQERWLAMQELCKGLAGGGCVSGSKKRTGRKSFEKKDAPSKRVVFLFQKTKCNQKGLVFFCWWKGECSNVKARSCMCSLKESIPRAKWSTPRHKFGIKSSQK